VADADVFRHVPLPTAEIQRMEAYLGPLADSVRALVDATIRTSLDAGGVERARAEIDAITARLRESQEPGPAGVRYNSEGYSWQWGNAAVGLRNAVAPPLTVWTDEDGRLRGRADLGNAYEAPPGMAHGGVLALLLDHLMGVTASTGNVKRPSFTGTLTLRYMRATMLGPVQLEGWIDHRQGRKTIVRARVGDAEGPTAEAEGVFITPRWAVEPPVTPF